MIFPCHKVLCWLYSSSGWKWIVCQYTLWVYFETEDWSFCVIWCVNGNESDHFHIEKFDISYWSQQKLRGYELVAVTSQHTRNQSH